MYGWCDIMYVGGVTGWCHMDGYGWCDMYSMGGVTCMGGAICMGGHGVTSWGL